MRILRAILRLIANHCPEPKLRHFLFKISGIVIGNESYINMEFRVIDDYEKHSVVIGNRVAIAPNVTIIVSSNPNKSKLSNFVKIRKEKVVIEDDVWIGTGVIIMPGITIGKCSIIGAGSVVTEDVEPYSIVVGVPAKRIGDVREKYGYKK